MPNNICVFIDGTWNDQADEQPTNIWRMRKHMGRGQTGLYFRGLGNEFDHEGPTGALARFLGGAFGAGAKAKRDEVLAALEAAWMPGDRIAIFGFSRGAAIARQVCVAIGKEGLRGKPAAVALLGCFDTVASYGIPGNDINLFANFRVAGCVEAAVHLVAADETRSMFPVTLMEQRTHITEVWLPGSHSDIGGGGPQRRGLSNIALGLMLNAAIDHGFAFEQPALSPMDPDQPPYSAEGYRLHQRREAGYLEDGEFHACPILRSAGYELAQAVATAYGEALGGGVGQQITTGRAIVGATMTVTRAGEKKDG